MSASLNLYPSPGGFVGEVNVSEPLRLSLLKEDTSGKASSNSTVPFIVILDQSGSMGQYVSKMATQLLPAVLKKLDYGMNTQITFILFESSTETKKYTIKQLEDLKISCKGGTTMSPAISHLEEVLRQYENGSNVRILTLSDGDVWDQNETVEKASDLVEKIRGKDLNVNSQAIRLFTSSYGQPDTRAVSSILQFSTSTLPSLLDIKGESSIEDMVDVILPLFNNDGFDFHVDLATEKNEEIWLSNPWAQEKNSLALNPKVRLDMKTVWLTEVPTSPVRINEKYDVNVVVHDEFRYDDYLRIFAKQIQQTFVQLKILKIVNTEASLAYAKNISDYFVNLESTFKDVVNNVPIEQLADDASLKDRLEYYRKLAIQKSNQISQRMAEIVNDDSVSKFDSAQSAAYLRSTSATKGGRGLARRGNLSGLDFKANIVADVEAMAEHISELDDVDDSEHLTSFVTNTTTLQSIRNLCSLTVGSFGDSTSTSATTSLANSEELQSLCVAPIEYMSHDDIIELLGIVGIACFASIRDYADPYTYSISRIHTNTYCTVSDLILASKAAIHEEEAQAREDGEDFDLGNEKYKENPTHPVHGILYVPGEEHIRKNAINNVIPVFSDPKIKNFLLKHAYHSLSYTASIGMRRMIADIPFTYNACIGAGVLKMLQNVQATAPNTPDDYTTTLAKLAETFRTLPFDLNSARFVPLNHYMRSNYSSEYPSGHDDTFFEKEEIMLKLIEKGDTGAARNSLISYEQFKKDADATEKKVDKANKDLDTKSEDQLMEHIYKQYNKLFDSPPSRKVLDSEIAKDEKAVEKDTEDHLTYLYNQSTPQLLSPLIRYFYIMYKKEQQVDGKYTFMQHKIIKERILKLLRTLYTDEVYKNCRRVYRGDNPIEAVRTALHRLLNIGEFSPAGVVDVTITPLFEESTPVEELEISTRYSINTEYVKELGQNCKSAEVVATFPTLLGAAATGEAENVKVAVAGLSNNPQSIASKLGINYDYNKFLFYNIVISLLYRTRDVRENDATFSSLLPDTVDEKNLEKIIIDYVKQQNSDIYQRLILQKKSEEIRTIAKQFMTEFLVETDIQKIHKLFLEPYTVKSVSKRFVRSFDSPVVMRLIDKLCDLSAKADDEGKDIALREYKLKLFMLGTDSIVGEDGKESNVIVFNNGNPCYPSLLSRFATVYSDAGKSAEWNTLRKEHSKKRGSYIFRSEKPNRHHHGKENPSYYTLGFDSYSDMIATLDEDEIKEYNDKHQHCCGVGKKIKREPRPKSTKMSKGIIPSTKRLLKKAGLSTKF